MSRIILTDLDSCVLDWHHAFSKWCHSSGMLDNTIYLKQEHSIYEFSDILQKPKRDLIELFQEFKYSEEFANMQTIGSSSYILTEYKNLGYEIYAITAIGDDPEVKGNREKNINNVIPDVFSDIICTEENGSKVEVLSSFDPAYWIEDNKQNAIDGYNAGHITILYDTPWNKLVHPQIKRIHKWDDLKKIIKR